MSKNFSTQQSTASFVDTKSSNKSLTWIPFYIELADKIAQHKDNRKQLLDIVYELDEKFVGYIQAEDGSHVTDIDPFTIYGIFNRGLTDDNRIKLCQYFKNKFKIKAQIPSDFNGIPLVNNMMATFYWRENVETDIQPLWDLFLAVLTDDIPKIKSCFDIVSHQRGIKWNITMGLFWIRPYNYIALDSRNRDYLPKLGIDVFKSNQINSANYFALLERVKETIEDHSIVEKDIPEISYRAWLSTSKDGMAQNSNVNYWLLGHAFGSTNSQLDRFIQEGIWEGYFDENKPIDQKQLALIKGMKAGDVIMLKSTAVKRRTIPFLRVKAVGFITSPLEELNGGQYKGCRCDVNYLLVNDKDFEGSVYGSYRKTVHIADKKVEDIVAYAHSIINNKVMPQKEYSPYIELLKETHNLVLTGAPGTGKTFIAQAIAREMGCSNKEMCFVQFHPSYDYTDFVEGLRPVEKEDGQIGFERKDGVFKEFCKRAAKNIVDSEKTVESLSRELSWEDKLQQFIEDAIDNEKTFKLSNGNEFSIVDFKRHLISVKNELNEKTTQIAVNADEIIELLSNEVPLNIVRDIRNYFKRRHGTQPDSYAYIIIKELRATSKNTPTIVANKVDKKPFVFIIDEINRGEASKIFGELFYAIDPGYRGKKDNLVQTQYQNLIPESDIFAKGFYVPENVYILATMNDIDRSVESMDFAMRRRFTWKEVTPTDTASMLDSLTCATEAKATMNRLNNQIAETEGLGEAYMIGPSYFLKLEENGEDFSKLWKMNIEPLLREYLRGFRKTAEILERFSKSYFNTQESKTSEVPELIDEN